MPAFKRRPRVFYGWYVLAASFVILFLNSGARYVIGIMVKPMSDEFGWSRGAISSAIFVNMAVYAVSALIAGRLYDRYGPKWVIAGSTLLFAAGYALMATMHNLWEFLLYFGVVSSAGIGGTNVVLFGPLIGKWFEKWRGFVISLAFAGGCVGQFVLLPVFSSMITHSGWRTTCLWIAGLSVVVNAVLAFGIIRGDPKKFGVQPFGRERREELDDAVQAEPGVPAIAEARRDLTLAEAMRTRSLWLFTAVMFICGGADTLITTHLVPMVTDYGLSTGTAASMLAWLGLVSLGGLLIAGPAADAIGNKIPIAITFALRIVLFVMLFTVKGTVAFWIFSLGFGLTLLVTAPLNATLIGDLYGMTNLGFISGFVNTVHMLGGGLWAYLGGLIYDRTGGYDLALTISAGLAGVAIVGTLLIREKRHLPVGLAGTVGEHLAGAVEPDGAQRVLE